MPEDSDVPHGLISGEDYCYFFTSNILYLNYVSMYFNLKKTNEWINNTLQYFILTKSF